METGLQVRMILNCFLDCELGLTALVSGNQLYHTAMLLMLQERPGTIQLQRKLVSQLSLTFLIVSDEYLVRFDI